MTPQIPLDELFGDPSIPAGMFHFPADALDPQLLRRQFDTFFLELMVDDGQIFLLGGSPEMEDQAEPV